MSTTTPLTTIDVNDDVRLIQRELAKGFVSRSDVDRKLDGLPDVAEKGEWVDLAQVEAGDEG